MNQTLKKIRSIERAAYPRYMRMLSDCETMQDVADYSECSIDELSIITGRNWYCIVASHSDWAEIVDLAAKGKIGADIFKLISALKNILSGKRVVIDARKSTSYPLIVRMTGKYHGRIIKDEPWYWNDEEMRAMEIQF